MYHAKILKLCQLIRGNIVLGTLSKKLTLLLRSINISFFQEVKVAPCVRFYPTLNNTVELIKSKLLFEPKLHQNVSSKLSPKCCQQNTRYILYLWGIVLQCTWVLCCGVGCCMLRCTAYSHCNLYTMSHSVQRCQKCVFVLNTTNIRAESDATVKEHFIRYSSLAKSHQSWPYGLNKLKYWGQEFQEVKIV